MSEHVQFKFELPKDEINLRVDKLTSHLLRHEKIERMLSEIFAKNLPSIKSNVKDSITSELIDVIQTDIQEQRQQIIDSYIKSKETVIMLEGKVIAKSNELTSHKEMPKLLSFLQLFGQALIVGPTGSGKSTMAKDAANALNLRYGSYSCNAEASKSELVGFANINGYVESQFLDFYENGGLFLIDEYDAMSPSIAVVLNAVFDRSGQISVPNRTQKKIAVKHKDFYCILAGNTWGSGSFNYQGREMQDLAFLDRFKLCRLEIGYDVNLEKTISSTHYNWFMEIRKWMKTNVENEEFSTRSIYDSTVLLKNGFTKSDVLKMISHHWDESLSNKMKQALL